MLDAEGPVELSIAAVGDVGIIGTARLRARRDGYEHLLAPLRSRLTGADLGFANLEMPVGSPDLVRADRSAEFWHEAEVCVALAHCGIGVVSLANSHVMDCGPRGLEMTLEACRDAGIDTVGAGHNLEAARRPARRTIRGRELLILAYAQNVTDHAVTYWDADGKKKWAVDNVMAAVVHDGKVYYIEKATPQILKMKPLEEK